jgi:hypothetical protein
MQVLSKSPAQVKQERAIRVCATASLESRTWLFKINDNSTRELIAWDFGQLPPYQFGWSGQLACFYAAAQAHRFITQSLPGCRVTIACISVALPRRGERSGRRWAA